MKKSVKYFKNAKMLSKAASLYIAGLAKSEVKKKGYFTLAVSGGESPVETYRELAVLDMPWKHTYIFWQFCPGSPGHDTG